MRRPFHTGTSSVAGGLEASGGEADQTWEDEWRRVYGAVLAWVLGSAFMHAQSTTPFARHFRPRRPHVRRYRPPRVGRHRFCRRASGDQTCVHPCRACGHEGSDRRVRPSCSIFDVVRNVEAAGERSRYVYDRTTVKVLPPIMYPTTMLNVAVNYAAHDQEMAQLRAQVPGMGAATSGAALPGTQRAGIWPRVGTHGGTRTCS